jgi:hypothetical protein
MLEVLPSRRRRGGSGIRRSGDRPRAGDILTLRIERDAEATRKLAEDTRKVQDQPEKTDPGGDLRL